jgi:Fe-S-cluster-containing hydrogenase component 2
VPTLLLPPIVSKTATWLNELVTELPPSSKWNCVCRQGKDKMSAPCQQTKIRRTCITLKGTARSLADSGVASALSREQTLALLDQAEEVGMILQPENTQDLNFICCSNFYARVDPELGTACETCSGRCQMDALSLVDEVTEVNLDRCIGCGLCVTSCPPEAIQLERKAKTTIPPKDRSSLYRQITVERFGVLGAAKVVGKSLSS